MRFGLTLLVLLASCGFAAAKVELRQVQFAHGLLGPERKSAEFVQGDEVYVRLFITGCQTDDEGRLRGELSFAVLDARGKAITERFVVPIQQVPALGAESIPARVSLQLGREVAAGDYTVEIEFKDLIGGSTASIRKPFVCKPEEFAIVAVRCYHDEQGRVPAAFGGLVGQTIFLKMLGVGFDRNKDEIDMEMTIELLDPKGKPLTRKPIRAIAHLENAEKVKLVPHIKLKGEIALNRAGDFLLRITLNDTVSKKKTTFETPLHVAAP